MLAVVSGMRRFMCRHNLLFSSSFTCMAWDDDDVGMRWRKKKDFDWFYVNVSWIIFCISLVKRRWWWRQRRTNDDDDKMLKKKNKKSWRKKNKRGKLWNLKFGSKHKLDSVQEEKRIVLNKGNIPKAKLRDEMTRWGGEEMLVVVVVASFSERDNSINIRRKSSKRILVSLFHTKLKNEKWKTRISRCFILHFRIICRVWE